MPEHPALRSAMPRDLLAGLVVFLVSVPLCLGVALVSGAPPMAGVLSGVIAGIVAGLLSGSHTSISGPAAGLTAVLIAQLAVLRSYETMLLAVVIAGLFQLGLGIVRAGFFSAFLPTSVIKGLLAAVGIILILKQIPHVLGHDTDPEGEMSFRQPDRETTFSEFGELIDDMHPGAALIGVVSFLLLIFADRFRLLKRLPVPMPLLVVVLGVVLNMILKNVGGRWAVTGNHLVQLPPISGISGLSGLLRWPDLSQLTNPAVYLAGLTIAAVASLESLLHLQAIDQLDRRKRQSPPSRELLAQGLTNLICGLVGAIPVTPVVATSSININAGSQTRMAAVLHGLFLLISVAFLSSWLNLIPLSCLAAILLVTGIKLAEPELFRQMWHTSRSQFIPFAVTVVSIVLTDLLIGALIGLTVSISAILRSNLRRPLRRIVEKHLGGEVWHIELANQVSFLNRAVIDQALHEVPRGCHLLLDARSTVYVDEDVLALIRDFKEKIAPVRGIQVSLLGFRERYQLEDQIQFVDYSSRDIQSQLRPDEVLQVLKDGNERFRTGRQLTRDLSRQISNTAQGQFPLAVVLSCIDSRTPAELIFDLGLGDIFNIRIAGNVVSHKVLASMEYGCAVAGAKLILVMGHTRCGAVTAAVSLACSDQTPAEATGCQHLAHIVDDIRLATDLTQCRRIMDSPADERIAQVDEVAKRNVRRVMVEILQQSETLARLVADGRIGIAGGLYDVGTGTIEFLQDQTTEPQQ